MNEFMTLEALGTFAGVSLVTGVVVQALKAHIPIKTQLLSLIIAFIVMSFVTVFTSGMSDISAYFLNVINAFVIAGVTSNTADFIMNVK